MTPVQLNDARVLMLRLSGVSGLLPGEAKSIAEVVDLLSRTKPDQNCAGCFWFEPADTCGKWNAKPPQQTLETGCESWQEGIPF